MDWAALFDVQSAVVVLGGTLGATLLRSGRTKALVCVGAMCQLLDKPFRYDGARADMAHEVEIIRHDGVIRAAPLPSSDADLAEATEALTRCRSVDALLATHARSRAAREARRRNAMMVMEEAGDLAPIFGLAGTLLALSQLPSSGLEGDAMMGTVATAVLTTLYGLLLAHAVLLPLARMIDRRGEAEETERQRLMDWLAAQIAIAVPDAVHAEPSNVVNHQLPAEAA